MDLLIAPGTVAEGQEDKAPATGTPGFATDGDPVKQTQRTAFPAYAFNDLLKEIRAVIINAGLKLDRNDTTQLLQAIKLTVTTVAGNYIGRASGNLDYSPTSGGVNISSGQMWFSYQVNGETKYTFSQVAGDYATNPALASETTRASTIESNLQSTKVNRAGDTMAGSLKISANSLFVGYGGALQGGTSSGSMRISQGIWFGNPNNASSSPPYTGTWQISDVLNDGSNDKSGVNLVGYDSGGTQWNWYFAWNGNISTPKGKVAFQSDLPFGANVHCQVFIVTIPAGSVTGYNSAGYTASIPTAFANFMYALGCDTNGGVYTVACSPSGNGAVKIYAQSPQNTAGNQTGGLALTIFAYGTYSS